VNASTTLDTSHSGYDDEGPLTRDGQPLKQSLARALRREKFRALMLIAPLLLFVLISFIFPIGDMLWRSVENSIVEKTIPGTIVALNDWDSESGELPDESVFTALADDMMLAQELKIHTKLGSRINYDQPGISSVFRKSGRKIKKLENEAAKTAFAALNPDWNSPAAWKSLTTSKYWPAEFPATTISLNNWTKWLRSEKGDDADPSLLAPYGFTYASLYQDIAKMDSSKLKEIASSPNRDVAALFAGVPAALENFPTEDFTGQFLKLEKGWAKIENWQAIKRLAPPIIDSYFLAAVDSKRTESGIEKKPENQRFYVTLFTRTIFLSLVITMSCILLGYPVAYLLATLSVRSSNMVLILVLLPFWTSLLVRTSAWKVLLQQQGVINDLLVWIGLVDDAGRLVMINNMTGTIIAMTHILLPFMILPLYSVMKTISPTYMRAAKSMGASDTLAFWRIYFPNTIPGIGAGSILVFILAIGYYITPALVGGTKGVFISNQIAYHISSSLNWGLAAALGSILLVMVVALYWTYDRLVGIDNVKLG
jgi:putative spermidine/putrescine transport system permease protein